MPVEAFWGLEEEPGPSPTPEPEGLRILPVASQLDRLLGFGLIRPFRRDQKNDFASTGGVALVKSAVGQILGTFCGTDTMAGEVPWNTEFGSATQLLRHRKNDMTTAELAKVWIADALRRWEPRVRLRDVKITQREATPGKGENVQQIDLTYDVLAQPRQGNRVLYGGVTQTVELGA